MTTVVLPPRPGTYISVVGQTIRETPPQIAEIVCVPITHDWGPLGGDANGLNLVGSLDEFDRTYGTPSGSSDSPGRRAVQSALVGSPSSGGGAGGVLVYRMAATAKAKGSLNLANTAGTPVANAVVLTAKYYGTRAANLRFKLAAHPTRSGYQVASLYDNALTTGAPAESWTFASATPADLVSKINATSAIITAVGNNVAAALATVASGTFTGSNDGSTLTSTEYVNALDDLSYASFSIIAFQNLTDSTIQATVLAWIREQVAADRGVEWVSGGGSSDDLAAALTRATALEDPRVINLGIGTYLDGVVVAPGQDPALVTTAQLAPRIAGMFAAQGKRRSLTFKVIDRLTAVAGTLASTSEIEQAIEGGVTVFSRADSQFGTLKVEKGVTTWIEDDVAALPLFVFGDPRLVRILDLFVRDLKSFGDANIIGNGPVNDASRAAVKKYGYAAIRALEADGLIVPGTGFLDTPTSNDPALRTAIPFTFGWVFNGTVDYVLGNGLIS